LCAASANARKKLNTAASPQAVSMNDLKSRVQGIEDSGLRSLRPTAPGKRGCHARHAAHFATEKKVALELRQSQVRNVQLLINDKTIAFADRSESAT